MLQKPTWILIQSSWIQEDSSSIPTNPLEKSSSQRTNTTWNSKSMLSILLLTSPSNTIFKRYLEPKYLLTCLLVTSLSSTSILSYKCNDALSPSSKNSIPTTSKMKGLNLNFLPNPRRWLNSILSNKRDISLSSSILMNLSPIQNVSVPPLVNYKLFHWCRKQLTTIINLSK